MPYSCTLVGRKWNLHKKDSDNSLGSHDTKRECTQQMRSIYANELSHPKNLVFEGPIDVFDMGLIENQITNSGDEINIVINSLGGNFWDAITIHHKLRNSGKTVIAHINPIAISAGAVLALAADKVYMPVNGALMFHVPKVIPEGMKSADDLEKLVNGLRVSEEMLVNTLMSKTKKTKEECEAIMRNDTWMTADEAKKMGIVDEIVPIYRDVQIQNYFPEKIVNFIQEKKEMPLKELCDQFGVRDETELATLITDLKKNQKPSPMTVTPSLLNMIKKSRETEIESLMTIGHITPVVRNELMKDFVTDERVKQDAENGSEEFNRIINYHAKNEPVISFKGSTGQQGGTRSLGDDKKNTDDDVCERLMNAKKKKLNESAV